MAEPLTVEEYAEWKGNIEALAEAHAGGRYTRQGKEFVPTTLPGDGITTTIGIQQRLFATIDDLQRQLREVQEERDFWPPAYERMSNAYTQLSFWTRALNQQSDTAIKQAEAAEARLRGEPKGFGHSHKHRHNERDALSHVVNDPAIPNMAGRGHTHDHSPTGHHAEAQAQEKSGD